MPEVITNPKFAPARKLIPERLKRVMDARIKIISGSGMDDSNDGDLPTSKEICIMEVTAYILGYETITDNPPCTSQVIRTFMIGLNDRIESDRKRAKLKHVIPDIVNTAPTHWYRGKLVQAKSKEYKKAEGTRTNMVRAFEDSSPKDRDGDTSVQKRSMKELHAFIRELAAVAHFDSTPPAPDPITEPLPEPTL